MYLKQAIINNKSKFSDIFQKVVVDKKEMFEIHNYDILVRSKVEKRCRENMKTKLQMLLGLKYFKGHMLIEVLLKLIKTTIELLIIDIESGDEVFISPLISQDTFPMSFHYYDPIQLII